uniref:Uncharacterized protein n=1 Tax=Cyprinus carpio TaxID=7962 RepID=A0A8C1G415_CYPCA
SLLSWLDFRGVSLTLLIALTSIKRVGDFQAFSVIEVCSLPRSGGGPANTAPGGYRSSLGIDVSRKNIILKCVIYFQDINECQFSLPVCGPNANCTNQLGSYKCSCLDGFTATNSNLTISINNTCTDFNECLNSSLVCGPNANCYTYNGNYSCSCWKGYNATKMNETINYSNPCIDINECLFSPSVCGPNSNCTNKMGSYSCSCLDGFTATNSNLTISINNICTAYIGYFCFLQINTSYSNKLTGYSIGSTKVSGFRYDLPFKFLLFSHKVSIIYCFLKIQYKYYLHTGVVCVSLHRPETTITIIIFTTLDKVLPSQGTNDSRKSDVRINGDVVVVKVNETINNISFTFDITDQSLGNPQCVFWNFILNTWDSTGCEVKRKDTGKITCECNHTTSFSILMSPFYIDPNYRIALAYITYIGVAISMASLIICLIIETIAWKSVRRNDTSYVRHVSIVNIAVSLLIANICFIIGAAIAEQEQPTSVGRCSPVVFFMHFFYLALFFWMLMLAMLLFYRTVMVLSQMSRAKMMVIAFIFGYGAPLLIAVITVASTAGPQNYISKRNACWLNWYESKALLAFVIPALTIVVINLMVLIVVLYKMLRREVGAATQPDEKHTLVVIARCVAFLTPIFGLTWGLGIGTMVSQDLGIHVVFALLNSLQVSLSFSLISNIY